MVRFKGKQTLELPEDDAHRNNPMVVCSLANARLMRKSNE